MEVVMEVGIVEEVYIGGEVGMAEEDSIGEEGSIGEEDSIEVAGEELEGEVYNHTRCECYTDKSFGI